jgi:FkbM family methyltransferase
MSSLTNRGWHVFQRSLLARALVVYGCRFPNHPRKWWLHDRLRRWLGIEIDEEVNVQRRGLRWSLNPADYACSHLYWLGTKDVWEIYHMKRLLRPGCVVIDAGANFGYHAATLATALNRQCRVIALEPHPANYARLVRHMLWNGLQDVVDCHELGVSDAVGTGAMVMPEGNSGHARIVRDGGDRNVAITTLDDFVARASLHRLDAVILDVEGYEDRALRGATKMLQRYRPLIVVELWPPVMEQQGTAVEAVADVLVEQGYRMFYPRRRRLLPLSELPAGDLGIYAFCFHQDRLPAGLL